MVGEAPAVLSTGLWHDVFIRGVTECLIHTAGMSRWGLLEGGNREERSRSRINQTVPKAVGSTFPYVHMLTCR